MSRRYVELANKFLSTPKKKPIELINKWRILRGDRVAVIAGPERGLIKKWRILRGDRVAVIAGPERGKQGVVSKVFRKDNTLIVEGVNLKRVMGKPGPDGQKPRKEWKEMGLQYSQVNLIDPISGLPTRIRIGYLEDGTKVRIAKRSGAIIPRPEILMERRTPRSTVVGDKDTAPDEVLKKTFQGLDELGQDLAMQEYTNKLKDKLHIKRC
eukprot:CAMPEP_0117733364 /NCGR_PEP_ID=MMETSP0947-20121206/33_1 /TAXON_ID=44440 /ORGANISM="Chattonella subsalsa, Strain CCMP2191" /LENGTH=210 /DNA_ID=CAMNT_0005547935 /DNA_START=90 /DNA_END=722 /DNA_ORIENTATION=+